MPNYTIDKLHKHFETNIDELLPSQSNNSGKYLTTNGTDVSWATVDALPTQTNNAGKFLTTNGTTASWTEISSNIPPLERGILVSDGESLQWNIFSNQRYDYVPDAETSTVNIPLATLNNSVAIEVYRNGMLLTDLEDYSINTTTGVLTLLTPLSTTERISIISKVSAFESEYILPIATSSTLGGVKIGSNLTIDPVTGVLSADAQSMSITNTGNGNAVTSVTESNGVITVDKGNTFSLSTHNHDGVYATPTDVSNAISNLVNSAPATLDTLNELATALGDDPNFATTVATQIGEKLDSDSANYIKSISVSGTTLTLTKGDDSTSTLTTQDTTYTAGTGIDITNGVISANDQLPTQTGNSGKFLTTNGETISWATVDALPSQSGNTGKYLYTDGSNSSWEDLPDFLLRSGGTLTGNIYGRPVVGSSSTATGDDLPVLFVSKDNTLNKGGTLDKARYFTLGAATDATGSLTNDHKFGQVQVSITTAGKVSTELIAYRNTANNATQAKIAISQDKNGNVSTEAPTPSTDDNSTKIATTAFVKAQGYITSSGSITGNAATATKLGTSDVGSATQPIYLAEGVPIATTYTLGKSVPSNAIFTDTTYTNGTGLDLTDTTFSLKTASSSVLGGIKVGNNLSIDSNGVLSATYTTYTAGNNITIIGTTISADDQLPTQTNNSGKFLTTNGATASWANVELLPDQANNAGKYLTTDGTNAYWGSGFNSETRISSVHYPNENDTTVTLTTAQVPSENISAYNLSVYRDGVYLIKDIDYTYNTTTRVITVINAFESEEVLYVLFSYLSDGASTGSGTGESLPSQTGNAGKFLTTNGTTASWATIPSGSGSSEDEIRISSLHYPTSGTTTITLTSAQNLPGTINKYALSIYRNGIYLNNTLDYTYNNSTGVITFTEAFTHDEVVVVNFAYLSSDSGTNLTYLDLAGTQTMTGSIRSNSQEVIHIANVTTTGKVITAYDDNNNLLGKLEFTKDSTGKRFVNIQSVDGNLSSQLSIVTDSTNTNTYITGPSISDVNDNSNKLATTNYVHLANNDRFGIATERVVNLTVDDNNLTINPSLGTLFKATLNNNTSVIINAPRSLYTNNGSTIGLHVTLTDEDAVVSWPQNVKWPDDTAPDLGYINIITFMTFDGGTTWYASLYVAASTFPST